MMKNFTAAEEKQIQELMRNFANRPSGLPAKIVSEAATRLLEQKN